jgi:hypothetical protein
MESVLHEPSPEPRAPSPEPRAPNNYDLHLSYK